MGRLKIGTNLIMKSDKVLRYPRKYSKIGIYHLMPRDNERIEIFIDKEGKRVIKEFNTTAAEKIEFIKKSKNSYLN